jgi:hypothetical protein
MPDLLGASSLYWKLAEPACTLKPIAVQEGSLHRVKFVALGEAFNGDDMLAFARSCKRQTRQDTLAVDDDRARAARALIAPLLGTGQTKHVAKRIQQRHALIHREFVPNYDMVMPKGSCC